jgi:DNA mismatch endonuclease (patch repair protein)
MVDNLSPLQRSRAMRSVRSHGTKPEITVRKALWRAGFRFRLHRADLPGRPDIVLPKYQTIVFVHGCFWHSHDCAAGRRPKSNTNYWLPKLIRNKRRDEEAAAALRALGWRVLIIWECEGAAGVAKAIEELQAISVT